MQSIEEFKQLVPSFTDEKLCEIVVSNRYLGILAEEAVECMKELAKRRENGSQFSFEAKIDEMVKSLPKINQMDLKNIFRTIKL